MEELNYAVHLALGVPFAMTNLMIERPRSSAKCLVINMEWHWLLLILEEDQELCLWITLIVLETRRAFLSAHIVDGAAATATTVRMQELNVLIKEVSATQTNEAF